VAQRVVEAVKARESKRLFHFRNKKTVADQIQKFAQVVATDHGDAQGNAFDRRAWAIKVFL
jgi:hypothetical protein